MKLDRRLVAVVAALVLVAVGAGVFLTRPGEAPPPPIAVAAAPAPQASVPAAPAPDPAPAQGQDAVLAARLAERSIGRQDAPVTVIEYFSLTCGHCAAFHRDTLPQVKRELVETGRLRIVYRDFPLDQTGLMAAMVARALPAERYDAFISTLFATQDRWAFNRNADPRVELFRLAALAGMSRETFDSVIADEALARGIMEARVAGQAAHNVTSTPTFVFGSRVVPGNMPFDRFAQNVAEAR
ncbi:MAG: thioredoxin domain-containing protein [Roseomonas sp.]|nr:thioredoxin domain-containing protein [Roseomonas sp.]